MLMTANPYATVSITLARFTRRQDRSDRVPSPVEVDDIAPHRHDPSCTTVDS